MPKSSKEFRKREDVAVPEDLRDFLVATIKKIESGDPQLEPGCAYPYEGDEMFGHECHDRPGYYEFTYYYYVGYSE